MSEPHRKAEIPLVSLVSFWSVVRYGLDLEKYLGCAVDGVCGELGEHGEAPLRGLGLLGDVERESCESSAVLHSLAMFPLSAIELEDAAPTHVTHLYHSYNIQFTRISTLYSHPTIVVTEFRNFRDPSTNFLKTG